ncbi:MAG: hypothetical protein D5S01_10110 [Halanaerobium sp. MSAO_Bac5]|nr:MAG: hypothetical protein D5S01_10110 [Halanaerobium sp. MSAO_Bac5]
MKYHRVLNNFWSHSYRNNWDKNTSLVAIYLLTNQHRNTEGIYELNKGFIVSELKMDEEVVDTCLEVLISEDFIRYDKNNFVVMITNCLKFHPINNPNHQKAALKKLEMLPNSYLLHDFLIKAARYCPTFEEFLLENFPKEDLSEIYKAKRETKGEHVNGIYNGINDTNWDQQELELTRELKQTQKQKLEQTEKKKEIQIIEAVPSLSATDKREKIAVVEGKLSEKNDNLQSNTVIDIPVVNCKSKKSSNKAAEFKNTRAFELTEHLVELIKENNKRARVPDLSTNSVQLQNWVKEIERLNRLGPVGSSEKENKGYSWKEIRKIIDFSQQSDFWSSNILSAKKLRKQVIILENQMKQTGTSKSSQKMNMLEELYLDALEEDKKNEKE